MRQAMANVRWLSVPGILWMEDAHLVAFSLMYDVCFCLIRCDENGKFMETVAERVICLLSSGGHFDVLEGLCSHGKAPVPRQAEKQSLNRQTMAWHQVHVDVQRYEYAGVRKWEDEDAELVDSDNSSSPLRASYADIVKNASPVSNTPTLVNKVKSQSHKDLPLPLPKRLLVECSVCKRKCSSKQSLDVHWKRTHSDETAFNDVAGHEMEDATDIASVVSEKSGACVEKECRASAGSETASVESEKSALCAGKECRGDADCEMESAVNEKFGAFVSKTADLVLNMITDK